MNDRWPDLSFQMFFLKSTMQLNLNLDDPVQKCSNNLHNPETGEDRMVMINCISAFWTFLVLFCKLLSHFMNCLPSFCLCVPSKNYCTGFQVAHPQNGPLFN